MRQKSYFWASYADLMTSLFLVMLILFASYAGLLYAKDRDMRKEYEVTKTLLDKIEKLQGSVKEINEQYFEYNEEFKKHLLTIKAKYGRGKYNPNELNEETREKLVAAGKAIMDFVNKSSEKYNAQFLVMVEGQASADGYKTDDYRNNDVLSYMRAMHLVKLWEDNGVDLRSADFSSKVELLVCGSGEKGVMRSEKEWENQRFLIHVVPKPGAGFEDKKNQTEQPKIMKMEQQND